MALSSNIKRPERMLPAEFAYPAASGTHIYAGAIVALNSAYALVRPQDAGALVVVGIADGERDNTAGTNTQPVRVRRGTWQIPVASAAAANIGATVYATDDTTLTLGGYTATVAAGTNTGTGTFSVAPTAGAGVVPGPYTLTMTGATAFTLTDPNGDALPAAASLAAYSNRALSFTLAAGGTAFVAGDKFTITFAQTGGGLPAGTLAGFEAGNTFVRLG